MAAKIFVALCTFVFINAVHSQVVRGGIAPNLLPITETILPNQVIFNPNLYPVAQNLINYEIPLGLSPPITVPATTTIIQDSTVANNLANALQLLIVSNLLSNTLPYMGSDVIVPGIGAPIALPGYGYVL
ncbi:unnamed protein product [Diatraea saccharalis]|uniref:Uncharacterized protein n=1 Tax=Diatraea saccharalis TaxID=40085 RepID=A0A9N9RB94_9NEOP|nr:unnamed protein product [Diatraea saccharalis]